MTSEVDGAEYLRRLKQDEHGPEPPVTQVTGQFLKPTGGGASGARPPIRMSGKRTNP